ncbi:MAG: hypothetical protein GTN89_06885 [Acidobacteria bacterium]|nr:hypothetical protein [Acidobacteriota bacterium]NIM62747.1 hypothetical protein [Acidobacteriota bacterium]NIO59047.1 hypothetical protein [Acidobacteriota bacterium]NIQ30086.1 hypothetical protein [Acidobacteriota bacterium]NIQ84889.1 hypothetical protein [Acidobacteriota bacterium]
MRIVVLLSALGLNALLPANADMVEHPLCPIVQHQIQVNLEDRESDVALAESRLEATRAIFDMAEKLNKDGLIERIRYLAFKYENDTATIDLERRRLLLERHKAQRDIYVAFCSHSGDERRTRIQAAQRRYEQTDCRRLGEDLAIAEIDLAYQKEVLTSVKDLRENNVATLDEVILAELDVEQARQRVEHYSKRARACAD